MRMRIPSTSNARPSNAAPGGTMGGKSAARPPIGRKPGGSRIVVGDEVYLWILVAVEVALMGWARKAFRRHHGG